MGVEGSKPAEPRSAPKPTRKSRSRKPYTYPGRRSSAPRAGTCRSCERPILVGYFDGNPIRLDIHRLDAIGEAEALLRGHQTYWAFDTWLYRRLVLTIREVPIPRFGYIHRTHICHAPAPMSVKPEPSATESDEPPF